jgi:hypothetical protein
MTSPNITINNEASFRESISELTALNSSLTEKLNTGGQAVIAAVAAAASKEVVYPGSGGVAAAYSGTIAALQTAVDNINAQAKEASTAVAGQIRDLTSLVDGLTSIDDAGADNVNATS